jgi:Uncharacterized conserved protein
MALLVAGIGTSHVPTVARAIDHDQQQTPAWKPLFDAYAPVKEWLRELRPDIAIVAYDDHGADFFLDRFPTFGVGVAPQYEIADEGFGVRKLPAIPGDVPFSAHLCESLVESEFDITTCQEMKVEHGLLVPLNLCFDWDQGWPVRVVPITVNAMLHPMPTARRCLRLGQAIRKAVDSYPADARVVVLGTGGLSHQLSGKNFGALSARWDEDFLDRLGPDPESIASLSHHELIERFGVEGMEVMIWLIMRGALGPNVRQVHRNYYAPMTTGMGLLTLVDEEAALAA